VPVILVTARKGVDRTLEGYSAGADDYLTKPFNFRELLARIRVQLRLVDMGRRLARQEKGVVMNLMAAGLAHEVRNPINAIINAVRPLLEGNLLGSPRSEDRAAAQELLEVVLDSAERVDTLIGDLLGVARPHADELADWRIGAALDSTLRLLKYKHGAEVHVRRRLAHRVAVVGRTAPLNQVLMNLLDNALKAGGPEVLIEVATETVGDRLRLRVCDDGPGIPSGAEERVFDPLYTTGDAASQGLGLHICRQIVEEHGGEIRAGRSALGGAELVVELPHAQAATEAQTAQAGSAARATTRSGSGRRKWGAAGEGSSRPERPS
jgi:signal transduction histidine kinase